MNTATAHKRSRATRTLSTWQRVRSGVRLVFNRRAPNPESVVAEARDKYLAQVLDLGRERAAFKASEQNRLVANWSATGDSINTFLSSELTRMRNRSRWLLRNCPNAISAMNAFTSYCVGVGIKPISTVYDKVKRKNEDGKIFIDQVENDIWNEETDDLWDEWAEDVDIGASVSCPESFYEVQKLLIRKWIEDGETFVHAVVDKSNGVVPLYLEFFEPESLDLSISENKENKNPVTMGVETQTGTGKPVAYWVQTDTTKPSRRYDAKYTFHFFERTRPGQLRGIPLFHGVTQKFFQLEDYEDTELIACKVASCVAAFIERPAGMTPQGDILPGNDSVQAEDGDGNKITHLQQGMIGSIPHGANFHVVSPQKPGATFEMFTSHVQRSTGAGIEHGLSYEALTRDTTGASYAGGRLAVQRDYQAFREIIHLINRKFNTPFRNLWVEIAATSAALTCPGYFSNMPLVRHNKRYWSRHEWIPPAWQYGVNPKDDVSASRDAMRAGMSTLDIECAFLGRDWRTVLRMKKKIKDTADRYGLELTSDGAVSIANGVENDDNSDEQKANKGTGNAATAKAGKK